MPSFVENYKDINFQQKRLLDAGIVKDPSINLFIDFPAKHQLTAENHASISHDVTLALSHTVVMRSPRKSTKYKTQSRGRFIRDDIAETPTWLKGAISRKLDLLKFNNLFILRINQGLQLTKFSEEEKKYRSPIKEATTTPSATLEDAPNPTRLKETSDDHEISSIQENV